MVGATQQDQPTNQGVSVLDASEPLQPVPWEVRPSTIVSSREQVRLTFTDMQSRAVCSSKRESGWSGVECTFTPVNWFACCVKI